MLKLTSIVAIREALIGPSICDPPHSNMFINPKVDVPVSSQASSLKSPKLGVCPLKAELTNYNCLSVEFKCA